MENSKMIRTAKLLDTAANIAGKLILIGFVFMILILAAAVFMPEAISGAITSITLGEVTLSVEGLEGAADIVPKVLISGISVALIEIALTWIGIRIIRKILKPMKEGRPFDTDVSASLKTLARIVLFGSILVTILNAAGDFFVMQSVDLTQFFNQDVVNHLDIRIHFDLTYLLFAGVLYLLSYIFRYGEELQKQSDETL